MRYSAATTALLVGAATAALEAGGSNIISQISDGQIQAPGPGASTTPVVSPSAGSSAPVVTSPAATSEVPVDQTVYQTIPVTVTSCAPAVKSCPATTSPYVTTTVIPVVSSSLDNSPVGETPQSSSPVETHPAPAGTSPVGEAPQSSSPVETHPAPAGTSPAPDATSALDNSPVGASSSCTCPPPVTLTSVVTVTPSGSPTGGAAVPQGSSLAGSTPGAGVPGAETPAGSTPGADVPGAGVPGAETPAGSSPGAGVPGVDVPGTTGTSPVGDNPAPFPPTVGTGIPAPFASIGTAPTGVATASTGGVNSPIQTGPPIAPFTGAASTLSGSFFAVGLTAIAAIFLV
ncbi:MAG: hypothetical protein Q9173_005106 [Seirophora scorigena]